MFDTYPKLPQSIQNKAVALFKKFYVPRWMVFVMDNIIVFIAFLFAYLLRFNFEIKDFEHYLAFNQAILALGIYATFSLVFRSYSGLIRHTTIIDIFIVFISATCSTASLISITLISRHFGLNENLNIPLSIILIHFVTLSALLVSIRILIKGTFQYITSSSANKKRILIFGAGAMGVIVKRVIQSDVQSPYQIAGFLDHNRNLHGTKLTGFHVYNPDSLSSEFLTKHNIQSVIFAIKDVSPADKSRISRSMLDLGLEVLEAPNVDTWLNGQFHISQIHKIKLEDLLGRDPISLNLKKIGIGLTDKTIMVTGAAGSIGSEIVRQLSRFNIKCLLLIDQAETPMFHIENELKSQNLCFLYHSILADTTNTAKMEQVFQEFRPEIVFHAAAYKHVPLMEDNPHEAIRVNIGGTRTITRLSVKYGVKKFVMISTDKAVNPTNVMGASKRICEMIVQAKSSQAGNKTQFVITRFGNVLGSNGSVIPLFSRQIESGGPVTVTHPEVTRYFMTIPEACQLVLEAGFMGKGGEIFVFDMGNPVKIVDLARQMIRLTGLIPDKDIPITFIGLRPGEKLYEELLTNKENTLPTHHPKIKIAKVDDLNGKEILIRINSLLNNFYHLSKQEVVDHFKELVPEFSSNNVNYINQQEYHVAGKDDFYE